MISILLAKFAPYLIAAGTAIAALLGYGAVQRRKGRKQAEQQAKGADHERASEIRDRVERDLPDRVRRYDDAGYRD